MKREFLGKTRVPQGSILGSSRIIILDLIDVIREEISSGVNAVLQWEKSNFFILSPKSFKSVVFTS